MTGASQGIGAEIARTLHQAGARVVINHPDASGGKIANDAERLAANLESRRQGSAMVRSADVSNSDAVKEMMDGVRQKWGEIDIPDQ